MFDQVYPFLLLPAHAKSHVTADVVIFQNAETDVYKRQGVGYR